MKRIIPDEIRNRHGARLAKDAASQPVILFLEEWACNFFTERNPGVTLATLPSRHEVLPNVNA